MHRQELIFALFAVLVALIWSAWDWIVYTWWMMNVRQRWVWLIVVVLVLGAAFIRGVIPVVWHYGNLILSLL